MKKSNIISFLALLLCLNSLGATINVNWGTTANYQKTQVNCYFTLSSGYIGTWSLPENAYVLQNNTTLGSDNLHVQWKNIEANANTIVIGAFYGGILNHWSDWTDRVIGPLTLNMPAPSFSSGSTLNIPCHATSPVSISLNSYINSATNGIDQGETITSHFEWTLPSGWQTTGGQTGTFVSASSINVIPPSSATTTTISVRPKAYSQYGPTVSLQITRNLNNFYISGENSVAYNSTVRYEVPSYPGVSYLWQLPLGWGGSSNENYIDVTTGCGTGDVKVTMTGCNDSKTSSLPVTSYMVPPSTTITGDPIVCSSGTQFKVDNVANGCSVTWQCSSNLSFDNQPGTPKTFTAIGTGAGWIKANVTATACGTTVLLPTKNIIWVGAPVITYISGPSSVNVNQPASFTAQLSFDSSPTNYYWTTSPSSGVTIYPDGRYASMSFANLGTYQVVARAQNSCGWSDYVITYVNVSNGYYLSISPNPITTEATIELVSTSTEKAMKETEWDLEVYDAMQTMKSKVQKIKSNRQTLSTSGWKDGVYIVRAIIGKDVISGKLVVKR
ncbi:autotransporter protein [Aquipluma nitroreducens]|uniref:Autotransporter protein n=1 Tax=Aquipluma nitroreducens TaxID=2010828 RepID=A0A5K7S6T2_9BACT|nr:autotransporter protein [Aquipluma nitroreducens]